jgi:hypothetical protein
MNFPSEPGSSLPDAAKATNDAIRDLVDSRAGGEWPTQEYEQLLIRWASAVRGSMGDIVEAA